MLKGRFQEPATPEQFAIRDAQVDEYIEDDALIMPAGRMIWVKPVSREKSLPW
jgi:hypothetical protein